MSQDHEQLVPETPHSKRRWLLIGLLVSVALNLMVVGIIIGARMNGGGPHAAMAHGTAFSVGRAIHQFSEPRRKQLWPLAKPHFQDLRSTLRTLKKAQRRFERAYKAEPIDLAELDASHDILSRQIATLQEMNFHAIRALSAELTAAERAQLLSALRPPRGYRSHKSRHEREQESARSQ